MAIPKAGGNPLLRDALVPGDDLQAVLEKADSIIMSYAQRIENQIKVIDRLLDGSSETSVIAGLETEIQNLNVRLKRSENLLARREKRGF